MEHCGVSVIDERHAGLMKAVGDAKRLMEGGHCKCDALHKLLGVLHEYVVTHFVEEEYFMQLYDVPEFYSHVRQHDEFIDTIERHMQTLTRTGTISIHLIDIAESWLADHIAKEVPIFREHMVGESSRNLAAEAA